MSIQSDCELLAVMAAESYAEKHDVLPQLVAQLFSDKQVFEKMLVQHEYLHQVSFEEVGEFVEQIINENSEEMSMTTIYTFNGKDITMNVVIQLRAIADIIKDKYGIEFMQALNRFYGSDTYQTLGQTENALWAESAEYIADRFFEEEEKASVKS